VGPATGSWMTLPPLKALEIEKAGIPSLAEVLREEGLDGVRYALWSTTGWHRDYSPPTWRSQATKEQKREAPVLHEAHRRQVEETMETLSERPEGL
jgi:hypothetical protein